MKRGGKKSGVEWESWDRRKHKRNKLEVMNGVAMAHFVRQALCCGLLQLQHPFLYKMRLPLLPIHHQRSQQPVQVINDVITWLPKTYIIYQPSRHNTVYICSTHTSSMVKKSATNSFGLVEGHFMPCSLFLVAAATS